MNKECLIIIGRKLALHDPVKASLICKTLTQDRLIKKALSEYKRKLLFDDMVYICEKKYTVSLVVNDECIVKCVALSPRGDFDFDITLRRVGRRLNDLISILKYDDSTVLVRLYPVKETVTYISRVRIDMPDEGLFYSMIRSLFGTIPSATIYVDCSKFRP